MHGEGAADIQRDRGRLRAWGHYKVVLEAALGSIKDEIDAAVDAAIAYFAVGGHVGAPGGGVGALEVVGAAGLLVQPFQRNAGGGAGEVRAQLGCAMVGWVDQRQNASRAG